LAGDVGGRLFSLCNCQLLVVTTDEYRMQSMISVLGKIRISRSIGAPLFFFATRDELRAADPLTDVWRDGNGKPQMLVK
jgi:hypothetical protein